MGVRNPLSTMIRNTECERILEMEVALDMVVWKNWFKKRDSRLITYSSGACRTQNDYILVRNKDGNLLKDVKVIPSEEAVSQHRSVNSDIKALQTRYTAFYSKEKGLETG